VDAIRDIIARPRRRVPLSAEMIRAREHEWPPFRPRGEDALSRAARHEHPVEVVVARMQAGSTELGIRVVPVRLGHALVGRFEHRGLVHVVPHAVDALSEEVAVEVGPPASRRCAREVGEHAGPGPDLADEGLALAILHPVIAALALIVHRVAGIELDAGIDHPDRVEPGRMQRIVQRARGGKACGSNVKLR
jgi:hypothetical protein